MLGVSALQCESWKQADGALATAVRQKPGSGLAWYLYGATCTVRGRYEESDTALKKSMELRFPDQSQLVLAWALIALNNANRKDAEGTR
jgi:cytochrome c-type biogenesis protein CcmH/NrfG